MIRTSPSAAVDRNTRLQIKEVLLTPKFYWRGAQGEIAFLSDLYALNELPSHDYRFETAYRDIKQHLDFGDYDESWVFDDGRFELMDGSDQTFLKFVAHTLHPRVRTDPARRRDLLKTLNALLEPCGYELYETPSDVGADTFSYRLTSTVEIAPERDPMSRRLVQPRPIGSGSYATVAAYVDPNYEITIAVKSARKNLDERELERFKQEFYALKKVSSPHVVEVYRYNEERNEYSMEYCDQTLEKFIAPRNDKLTVAERKRIALQFLSGLSHIHAKGLLHRDLSVRNVLVKLYDGADVVVKISDLGLVKDLESNFTRTGTQVRGTHIDEHVEDFRDFNAQNEIYAVGYVLQYIFTGRDKVARPGPPDVHRIVERCTTNDLSRRYKEVREVIADVEALQEPAVETE